MELLSEGGCLNTANAKLKQKLVTQRAQYMTQYKDITKLVVEHLVHAVEDHQYSLTGTSGIL
jgi:hypothetical protein